MFYCLGLKTTHGLLLSYERENPLDFLVREKQTAHLPFGTAELHG